MLYQPSEIKLKNLEMYIKVIKGNREGEVALEVTVETPDGNVIYHLPRIPLLFGQILHLRGLKASMDMNIQPTKWED